MKIHLTSLYKKKRRAQNIPPLGSSWMLVPVRTCSRSHLLSDTFSLTWTHFTSSVPVHKSQTCFSGVTENGGVSELRDSCMKATTRHSPLLARYQSATGQKVPGFMQRKLTGRYTATHRQELSHKHRDLLGFLLSGLVVGELGWEFKHTW